MFDLTVPPSQSSSIATVDHLKTPGSMFQVSSEWVPIHAPLVGKRGLFCDTFVSWTVDRVWRFTGVRRN